MVNYEKQIENTISRMKDETDVKIINIYIRWMQDKNRSIRTIYEKVRIDSKMLDYFEKDVHDITREDMMDYIYSDELCKNHRTGEQISNTTIDTYKAEIRYFMKWVSADYGIEKKTVKSNNYPESVDWIEFSQDKGKQKLPEDLLTEEEILAMLENEESLRNQTLIAILYDSFGRLNEVRGLNQDSINPDDYGFYAIIKDRTSKTYGRRVRLNYSVPYVRQFLKTVTAGKPLFISREGNRLSEMQIQRIVKKAAKQAGIEKNVFPHLFRHSGATNNAKKLPEQQLKKIGGWKPNSRMVDRYIHLSGVDTDKAQLEAYGLIPDDEEPEVSPLKPKKCPKCKNENPASQSAYCVICGFSLDGEIPIDPEIETLKRELEEIKKRDALRKDLLASADEELIARVVEELNKQVS